MFMRIGIPCRYVSGYLSPGSGDRSAEGATHAWAEAYLPTLGSVGFDPTNDVLAAERHIRVAIGRDYADVPPTRGVLRGEAGSAERARHCGHRVPCGRADSARARVPMSRGSRREGFRLFL